MAKKKATKKTVKKSKSACSMAGAKLGSKSCK